VGAAAPVIRVEGFGKRYGQRVAAQDVSLEVARGEIYGLIGPDGAGKSSLMKAIAGVLSFESGRVAVLGTRLDSEAAAEHIKDRLGFMPQGLGLHLYPELSVEENIDFFARLREVSERDLAARKQKLLAMTRLAEFHDRPMKNLSGGMKQKLGLACTLIHEPELIVLDEPTTGVDPVSRRDFWGILAALLRERGTTALVSTAYMDEASRFHRVSLFYGGRVVASGEPDAIQAMAPGSEVRVRVGAQAEARARLQEQFAQVEALGPWLRVFVPRAGRDAATNAVRTALAGMAVEELVPNNPDLEDVFIALLRERELATLPPDLGTTAPQPSASADHGVAIEASGLTRDFGTFRAVDDVSFRVAHGEIFGLLGANGAGKTTVIKMLTGILAPTKGEGHVAGADMRRAGTAIKRRIGYVSQAFSLYTDLTVQENILLYAGVYGLTSNEARERAAWVLDMGGLHGHERDAAASLPMGLRQRLALGCALVHRPQVLFLDEPTSGVDPIGRRRFWDILFRLSREEGVAILITTHYMLEAEHCDRLALLFAGRIVADAPPATLKREVEAEAGALLEIDCSQPLHAMERLAQAGFRDTALFGRHIHVLSATPARDRERIPPLLAAGGIDVASIEDRPLSMEDVFVYRVTALEKRAAQTKARA
jgi:ABC-type multidrug transport system ATPase subunit